MVPARLGKPPVLILVAGIDQYHTSQPLGLACRKLPNDDAPGRVSHQ
jgi:hypothetical protein